MYQQNAIVERMGERLLDKEAATLVLVEMYNFVLSDPATCYVQ